MMRLAWSVVRCVRAEGGKKGERGEEGKDPLPPSRTNTPCWDRDRG